MLTCIYQLSGLATVEETNDVRTSNTLPTLIVKIDTTSGVIAIALDSAKFKHKYPDHT
jgi:hypothetical protein